MSGKLFRNPNWEKFCQLFASDIEFFGNGTQSYIEAFPRKKGQLPMSYLAARVKASQLLTNPNILARINEILDLKLSNEIVDKNLGIVVLQNADFKAKVQAIKEYNALKNRVRQNFDITSGGRPIPILDILNKGRDKEKKENAI